MSTQDEHAGESGSRAEHALGLAILLAFQAAIWFAIGYFVHGLIH